MLSYRQAMNTNNDPNLNDINYYDANDVLQIGFADPDIQIAFDVNFGFSTTTGWESTIICNEEFDEPSKLTSYQCDKLFENEIILSQDWISNDEDTCVIKRNEDSHIERKFKIWKCQYNCGKIFTKEKYMKNHIVFMHENEKLISCKICCRHLSNESRLRDHMLRHSKVKHLICLICMKKRTKELSCMRHHLLNKHNIGHKHSLFQEAYYHMSLKEIAVEERYTKNGSSKSRSRGIKSGALHEKLIEKAKSIHDKLQSVPKNNELEQKIQSLEEGRSYGLPEVQGFSQNRNKIMTAENGMKLVRLSNGQFRKFTD